MTRKPCKLMILKWRWNINEVFIMINEFQRVDEATWKHLAPVFVFNLGIKYTNIWFSKVRGIIRRNDYWMQKAQFCIDEITW